MDASAGSDPPPRRTSNLARRSLVVVVAVLALVLAMEGFQRVVHGSRNPTAELPPVPGPVWTSRGTQFGLLRDCVALYGRSGEATLSWTACEFTSEVFADVVTRNVAASVRDGATNETRMGLVSSQPVGTAFVRTCFVVDGCDYSEDLRLIGRLGSGYWELFATWVNPDEADGPATRASREQRFAQLMVHEWYRAAA